MRDKPYGYGGGGMIGSGQGVGGATAPNDTTAGQAGGWSNIQDFLGANTGTPKVQGMIEQKGKQQLGTAAKAGETARSGVSEIPSIQAFTPQAFQSALAANDYGQIRTGAGGQYTPFQGMTGENRGAALAGQELPTQTNPFENIQPGVESIMNYFGQLERPSSQYTPGMSKMDEMLLRGQKDFVKDYPGELKEQFKGQVTDPMQAGREARALAHEGGALAAGTEGERWKGGINDYLQGEQGRLFDEVAAYKENYVKNKQSVAKGGQIGWDIERQKVAEETGIGLVGEIILQEWEKNNPKPGAYEYTAGNLPEEISNQLTEVQKRRYNKTPNMGSRYDELRNILGLEPGIEPINYAYTNV